MTSCNYITRSGGRCRAQALGGESWCSLHHPRNQDRIAAGRRQGGARRRRSTTTPADPMPLDSAENVRAVLEVALTDALNLDPSVGRVRAVVSVAAEAARLLERHDLEQRLSELEAAIAAQLPARARR